MHFAGHSVCQLAATPSRTGYIILTSHQKEKPPEGGFSNLELDDRRSNCRQRPLGLATIGHKSDATETQDHHCPC
jgi:hypothetical protein